MPGIATETPEFNSDPTWLERELSGRLRADADDAREQRAAMTAAIARLADATADHNAGAKERHRELIVALQSRDVGAEKAMRDLAAEKSVGRRWIEAAVTELWASFRVPLAGLVTAGCAYYAWAEFQIPAP